MAIEIYLGSNLVSSATMLNNTTIYQSSSIHISNGGITRKIGVCDGGIMKIFSGGTADHTSNSGDMYVSSGGIACGTVNKGQMYICSGGVASNTTNYGSMHIYSGAILLGAVFNQGKMFVSKGAVVNDILMAYGDINVWGEVNGITSCSGGTFWIYGGGIANNICLDPGDSNHGVDMQVHQGGIANRTIVMENGRMFIWEGGIANDTTISVVGRVHLLRGGTANSTTMSGGYMYISSGGVANSTTVNSGHMRIDSGGCHKGSLQIENGAVVSAYGGAIIDFTVADRTEEDGYLINDLSRISGAPTYTITVAADQTAGTYKLAQGAGNFTGTISIGNGTVNYGSITINGEDFIYDNRAYSLDNLGDNLTLTVNDLPTIKNLQGDCNNIAWNTVPLVSSCMVEYSTNNFANSLRIAPATNAVDTYGLPQGNYQWRVSDGETWYNGDTITAAATSDAQTLISDHDGDMDLFFGNANGTWEDGFEAEHQGILNNWIGTREHIALEGKNKIADVFSGSTDANILVLTDSANGDALFVDDIYTALPGTVEEQQARIAEIDEIRAGLGDDVVDLTSQKFAYAGDGVKIYGGLGNDTIWANNGKNILFGDAGNDRIVGGSGDDVIIGGVGNDSMHGGGGDDIFCFGEDWGKDTIEQLSTGSVTLWFEEGSAGNWNAATLTYTDGANSVKVSGISSVTLKFGTDTALPAGCFDAAASEKIFEDKDKGMLA